jgi:hypothetical protein
MHPHKHKYKFETKVTNRHKHTILGYTDHMIGIGAFHIHAYYGISSYCGHTHYFSGFTGFPSKTENGHIHKMDCRLESTSHHEHIFRNYTDEDIEYISQKKLHRAYV